MGHQVNNDRLYTKNRSNERFFVFVYNSTMQNDAQTVIEWTYEPTGFFEEFEKFRWSDGNIEIKSGIVRGVFDAAHFEKGRNFRDEAHEQVKSRFIAQQILTDRAYSLSVGSLSREYADGRRDVTAFLQDTLKVNVTLNNVDVVVRNATGKIVSDTKADRLERQKLFREQVAWILPNDNTLKRMLQSYSNALTDPENALIHLYEICDALTAEFDSEKIAKATVGASNSKWSKFGRIANNEPFLEGRHRGKHVELQAINREDLEFMKSFARSLIMGYVEERGGRGAKSLSSF